MTENLQFRKKKSFFSRVSREKHILPLDGHSFTGSTCPRVRTLLALLCGASLKISRLLSLRPVVQSLNALPPLLFFPVVETNDTNLNLLPEFKDISNQVFKFLYPLPTPKGYEFLILCQSNRKRKGIFLI